MVLTSNNNEPDLFRGGRPALRFLVLAVISVVLMILDHQNQHLTSLRSALSIAAYPLQQAVNTPSIVGRWADDTFAGREELSTSNQELQKQLLLQGARLQRLAALEEENRRLRALLESTDTFDNKLLIAEIISVDMNPYRHTILINKGGNDGVLVGQALIDAEGIIGQIVRAQPFAAEAILITDADHAIPVEVLRNRLRSIAIGTGDLERLTLPFLPGNADVIEGDLLVSSGLGGTFPAGYPVGVVTRVVATAGQPFLGVEAKPAALLNRIREVLLIWPETGGGKSPQERLNRTIENPAGSD
jgi:rod shape-determining protein MreC